MLDTITRMYAVGSFVSTANLCPKHFPLAVLYCMPQCSAFLLFLFANMRVFVSSIQQKAKTPHLDTLVQDGVELDRHYVYYYCGQSKSGNPSEWGVWRGGAKQRTA